MKKLLFGAGALLLASVAVPAAAQEWGGYSGYGRGNGYGDSYGRHYGYGDTSGRGYGYNYADVVRQHVRACRKHARIHERLSEERRELHGEGFDGGWDHRDVHDELGGAHDAYHDSHPGANNCSYWNRQYYNMLNRSRYGRYGRSYGYGGY